MIRSIYGIDPMHLSALDALDEYYSWLCDTVRADDGEKKYTRLMKILHSREFTWSVPNDDNRAFEGMNLREQFCEENGIFYEPEYFSNPCSMLELILGLAIRCHSIMADQDVDMPLSDWFWKLLSNVGLDTCTDDIFDKDVADDVEYTLDKIIERRYGRDGNGGLFPLKNNKKDQRKVELWYQMNYYLVENYYTEDLIV